MNKSKLDQKILQLKEVIPFRLRIGSGIGTATQDGAKKTYQKYLVLPYIDARDCMDRLDEIFGSDRQKTYKDIAGKSYCEVSLFDGDKRSTRSDVGDPTAISKNKGEASDSFKRACVSWGLGRFLYTMPKMQITAEEGKKHKFEIHSFMMSKYKPILDAWQKEFDSKLTNLADMMGKSKYSNDDGESQDDEDILEDGMDQFGTLFKPGTRKSK